MSTNHIERVYERTSKPNEMREEREVMLTMLKHDDEKKKDDEYDDKRQSESEYFDDQQLDCQ